MLIEMRNWFSEDQKKCFIYVEIQAVATQSFKSVLDTFKEDKTENKLTRNEPIHLATNFWILTTSF